MKKLLLAFLLASLPVIPAAWADGLPDLGEYAQTDLPPMLERKIGEATMNEIRLREPTYLDDPEVIGYLNQLGRKLASNTEESHQEFEFFALRDPTLNAFAMPGGFIGVHTGLILATQSESELASVLAHEISHVTQHHLARQVSNQSQSQWVTMLSLAVAVLAARSHGDVAQGAIVGGQAAAIQNQLSYSRDFEREADRMGLNLLEKSGYDVRGMASFFDTMEKSTRIYETSAPGYLRTHPMTTERISDVNNRIQSHPYRQVADSLGFLMVRAKLRSQQSVPEDAVKDFQTLVEEGKVFPESVARYGLAEALLRAKNYADAEKEVKLARQLKLVSPMLETLAAELRTKQSDTEGAVKILRAAAARYPTDRSITYALAEALLANHQSADALRFVLTDLQSYTTDPKMYLFLARANSQLGRQLQQHRAQAEAYLIQGQLLPAIEQLTLAQKAPDGDFYEHSQVDARLRELKARHAEETKQRRGGGSGAGP